MGRFLAVLVGCLIFVGCIGAVLENLGRGDNVAALGWLIISVLVAVCTGVCHWYPKELDGK